MEIKSELTDKAPDNFMELAEKHISNRLAKQGRVLVEPNHRMRFECMRCGGCCLSINDDFWLMQYEVDVIVDKHPEYKIRFERDVFSSWKWRLVSGSRMCPFLREFDFKKSFFNRPGCTSCAIYDVRPFVCRIYPYLWGTDLVATEDGIGLNTYAAVCSVKCAGMIKRNKIKRWLRLRQVLAENAIGINVRIDQINALFAHVTAAVEAGKSVEEAYGEVGLVCEIGEVEDG